MDFFEGAPGRVVDVETDWLRAMMARSEHLGRMGSWMIDLSTGTVIWSAGLHGILSASMDGVMTVERALGLMPAPIRASVERAMEPGAQDDETFDVTCLHAVAGSGGRWLRSSTQRRTEADGSVRLNGIVRDVTDEHVMEEQLRHLARDDALTGLCNRRRFVEELEAALAAGGQRPGPLLVLGDVDGLKAVNDVHGHAAGDSLLIEVARRLESVAGPDDLVARLGGDEFAMILAGSFTPVEAHRRLAALVGLFDETDDPRASVGGIGISLGAAICPGGDRRSSTLLTEADCALYQAKALGRRQACLYDQVLHARIEGRKRELREMGAGLGRNELEVFYQPIVDLRTAAVRGVEALVRWRHPSRGLLPASAFASSLADPRLSLRIGDFVLDRSLRQMREWINGGLDVLCVNVNVSYSQLQRGEELFRLVHSKLGQYGLSPDRLKVEIVESVFLGNHSDAIVETLARLQLLGVVVALDDFGTGFASLTHLKQLQVGRIKIDRSFIQNLGTDESSAVISRSIIDLGANLGMRVVAEGVDDLVQLASLLKFDCDCGQGYLFSRPLPADAMQEFLDRWNNKGHLVIARARGAPMPAFATAPIAPFDGRPSPGAWRPGSKEDRLRSPGFLAEVAARR